MYFTIMKRIVAVILLIAVCCTVLPSCANKQPDPKDTIVVLQNAVNNYDIAALFSCIDSQWAGQIESLLNMTVGENGPTVNSFITLVKSIIPVLPYVTDGAIDSATLPEVAFTVLEEKINENEATLALSGLLIWGEYSKPFAATVNMKLENEIWVIFYVS